MLKNISVVKGLLEVVVDLVPEGADPLGPDNILHFGVGPLTGLAGAKTIVCFKSR